MCLRLFLYSAYNSVKHDRNKKIPAASLENILKAIAGVYAILVAQFDYLACDSWHDTNSLEKADGFFWYPKSLFAVKVLDNWLQDEEYEFDWSVTKNLPEPFEKHLF